ncbi:DUF1819 family protein [Ruminococcus flavefaciens]|uniref:DUF1819 family protein n=1 Tax=Ruminococcus flavefaciens TaxID=1265 RepID=UPI0018AD5B5F|nr:DUF1819 family protein [Ruminococcus flavefaciens]
MKKYTSAIKKTPFKYAVSRIIAKMMLEGKSWKEINLECFINNAVSIDSEQRRREVINVAYKRLCSLDNILLDYLCNGDITTSKFILVYAISKTDLLFFEFLFEKYRESLVSERNYLSPDDFDSFVQGKKESNCDVAKWGQHTIECLIKGYRNILVESGMGIREGRRIETKKMIIHPDIAEHICSIGDAAFLEATLGGSSL